jgi:unsaturated chondroitin disaccharide hydrolase
MAKLRTFDFETGDTSQWNSVLVETFGASAIVKTPVKQGTYAWLSRQTANNDKYHRAELQWHQAPAAPNLADIPVVRFYRWAFNVTSVGAIASGARDFLIMQHRMSFIPSAFTGGISVRPHDMALIFQIRAGSHSGQTYAIDVNKQIATIQLNRWYVVEEEIRWSRGTDGYSRVWIDGVQTLNYSGANVGTPEQSTGTVMFRQGIYAGVHTGTHEVIFDDGGIWDSNPGITPGGGGGGTTTPTAPTGLKATISPTNAVTLDWNDNPAAETIAYYAVRRSTQPSATAPDPATATLWTRLTTNFTTSTATDDLSTVSEGTYWYFVTANTANGALTSPPSSVVPVTTTGAPPVLVPISAPSGVTATNDGTNHVVTSWTPNALNENVDFYNVFRSIAPASVAPPLPSNLTIVPPEVGGIIDISTPGVIPSLYSRSETKLELTDNTLSDTQYPHLVAAGVSTWTVVGADHWTSGFAPNLFWRMFARTGSATWKARAQAWQAAIDTQKAVDSGDLGFMFMRSFATGYDLTGDTAMKTSALAAASTLDARYNSVVKAVRSWNSGTNGVTNFNTIIDSSMNMELLFWAARNGGSSTLYTHALEHMRTLRANHLRSDGSTHHVVEYNTTTGAVISQHTAQGFSNTSTWSRGQAWAMYGFMVAYRETLSQNPTDAANFLATAKSCASYFVDHLPADGIPKWDFDATDTTKDSSAAAIAAAALLWLAKYDSSRDWRGFAKALLDRLGASAYFTTETTSLALLRHGTSAKPQNVGVDANGLIYGDALFVEALDLFVAGSASAWSKLPTIYKAPPAADDLSAVASGTYWYYVTATAADGRVSEPSAAASVSTIAGSIDAKDINESFDATPNPTTPPATIVGNVTTQTGRQVFTVSSTTPRSAWETSSIINVLDRRIGVKDIIWPTITAGTGDVLASIAIVIDGVTRVVLRRHINNTTSPINQFEGRLVEANVDASGANGQVMTGATAANSTNVAIEIKSDGKTVIYETSSDGVLFVPRLQRALTNSVPSKVQFTATLSIESGTPTVSPWSYGLFFGEIGGTTPPPAAPVGLTVAAIRSNEIDLTWTASPDLATIDTYQVYQDGVQIKDGLTTPAFTVTGLANGVPHSYTVTAGSSGRLSPQSSAVTATASGPPPVGSSIISVSPGSGTTPQTLTVGVNTSSLTPGVYKSEITLTPTTGSITKIPVTIEVRTASDITPPAAPVGLASPNSGEDPTNLDTGFADLTWTANTETDLHPTTPYQIERGVTSSGPWSVIGTSSTPRYTARLLPMVTDNYFVVRAMDKTGNLSARSTPVLVRPVAQLTAISTVSVTEGNGQVTFTWPSNPTKQGISTYRIYVRPETGSYPSTPQFDGPGTIIGNSRTATVGGLTNGTKYFFKIVPVQ